MWKGCQNIFTTPSVLRAQHLDHVRQLRDLTHEARLVNDSSERRYWKKALSDVEFEVAYDKIKSRREILTALNLWISAQTRHHDLRRWKALAGWVG